MQSVHDFAFCIITATVKYSIKACRALSVARIVETIFQGIGILKKKRSEIKTGIET